MTYQIKDTDGKIKYVKRKGEFYYITKDSKGALEELPEGFKILRNKNGRLYIKRG